MFFTMEEIIPENHQPSWTPVLSRMVSSGICPNSCLLKCSPEVQNCDPAFCFFPPHLRILHATIPRSLLPPTFTSLTSLSLPGKYKVQENVSPHWLLNHLSGSHYQRTPETSWIACALLYCPSSRYWGGWLKMPMRIWASDHEISSNCLKTALSNFS